MFDLAFIAAQEAHQIQAGDGGWWDGDETASAVSAKGLPYLFTGREFDPLDGADSNYLQLQYSRARYYSYPLRRWLQRDPIGYADGMSLYEYVKSGPTKYTDPTGEGIFCWIKCAFKCFGCPGTYGRAGECVDRVRANHKKCMAAALRKATICEQAEAMEACEKARRAGAKNCTAKVGEAAGKCGKCYICAAKCLGPK